MVPDPDLPTYAHVEAAARRLEGHAHRTPVLTSGTVDRRTGAKVYFKCENFQRSGAFKFRGAYNALSQLGAAEKSRGVVTFSSGNHAQAVALSAQLLGIRAVIVMPDDAASVKLEATRGYGAEVITYDKTKTTRESIARALALTPRRIRQLWLEPEPDLPLALLALGTPASEGVP